MAVTRASAKALFQRGDRPTSAEFAEIWDSVPIAPTTAGQQNLLDLVATTAQMSGPTLTSGRFVTPGLQHYHPLMPKAWVVFNGVGTVSIRDSYNVGSIGDIGTGVYRINWGSAFGDANYSILAHVARSLTGGGAAQIVNQQVSSPGARSLSDVQLVVVSAGAAPAVSDVSLIDVWAIDR